MRGLRPLMIAFAVLSGTAFADSVSLSFSPFSQNVTAGQTISVQVQISGLGNFAVPSVGSFDLFVSFDPTLLSPTTVTFGSLLGDPNIPQAITASQFSATELEFAEVSLLTPGELAALQPGTFVLSTLSFTALTSGTATFKFSAGVVDDPFGQKLVVVPEPGTLFLVASGFLGLPWFRRGSRFCR
ncbi:MAG: hypothetical protein DMG89_05410 [Acidobacteria bacterium]|nr:MAG: hypothetical protein DMG89_05410 [Acidobacteriota bacterium]